MYNVIFKNVIGEKRIIATTETFEQASKAINDFLEKHHYIFYYKRFWKIDDKTTKVDYGEHTSFFYIQEFENNKEYLLNVVNKRG